jgi:hypothetical protein
MHSTKNHWDADAREIRRIENPPGSLHHRNRMVERSAGGSRKGLSLRRAGFLDVPPRRKQQKISPCPLLLRIHVAIKK